MSDGEGRSALFGFVAIQRLVDCGGLGAATSSLVVQSKLGVASLAVRRDALPGAGRLRSFGFIHCVDNAGVAVFTCTQQGPAGAEQYVCVSDMVDRTLLILPSVPASLDLRPSSQRMAIVSNARGGGRRNFIVAQLSSAGPDLKLLCYSSATHSWSLKAVEAPPSNLVSMSTFRQDLAISHGGQAILVNLSAGLLIVDPFADKVASRFVALPLPGGRADSDASHGMGQFRCVMPSGGELCYVLLHGLQAPTITTWKTVDLMDGGHNWLPQYSVALSRIPLPAIDQPSLGLVHPTDSNILYLFLGTSLIAVDLEKEELLDGEPFHLHEFAATVLTSLYLWPWIPPPSAVAQSDWQLLSAPQSAPRHSRLRKGAGLVLSYLKEHPDKVFDICGTLVEEGGMFFLPVSMASVTAMLAKLLKETGKALKHRHEIAGWLHAASDSENFSAVDVVPIKNISEAQDAVAKWESLGRPLDEFKCMLSAHLSTEESDALRDFFRDHGASDLLVFSAKPIDPDDYESSYLMVLPPF